MTRHDFKNLIEVIALSFFSILYFFVGYGVDSYIIVLCLFVFYLYFYSYLTSPLKIGRINTFFKIDIIFSLFYFLLLYYPYQTYLFGSTSIFKNIWVSNTYWEESNRAIILSTIGFIAFNLGYSKKIKFDKRKFYNWTTQRFKMIYSFLLIVTLAFLYLYYTGNWSKSLANEYTGSKTGDSTVDGVGELLMIFMIITSSITVSFFRKIKKIDLYIFIFLILFTTYSLFLLIEGNRNVFFIAAISLFGGFYSFIKQVGRVKLMVFGFLAILLYQIIEISRKSDVRSIATIIQVFSNDNDIKTSSEVGGGIDQGSFSLTNLGVRLAINKIPRNHDFTYGKFKLIGLAGIIPYARSFIIASNDKITTSSVLLTTMAGTNFGIGTSIISDSYIEFGLFGVIFILFSMGLWGGFVRDRVKEFPDSVEPVTIYLVTLAFYSEVPRYTFDFALKGIIWTLIILYFLNFIFRNQGRKQLWK